MRINDTQVFSGPVPDQLGTKFGALAYAKTNAHRWDRIGVYKL